MPSPLLPATRAPSSQISFIEPSADSDDGLDSPAGGIAGDPDAAAALAFTVRRRRNRLFTEDDFAEQDVPSARIVPGRAASGPIGSELPSGGAARLYSTVGPRLGTRTRSNAPRRYSTAVEWDGGRARGGEGVPVETETPNRLSVDGATHEAAPLLLPRPADTCEDPIVIPRPSLATRLAARLRPLTFLLGGPICALAAVAFAKLSDTAYSLSSSLLLPHTYLLPLLLPPCFALVLLAISRLGLPGARGGGVVQCILSLAKLGSRLESSPTSLPRVPLDPKTTLAKFLLTPVALALLAPAGREGPTVQLCAGLMWSLGLLFKWSPGELRAGVLAGAAGGVASAFGTGLGGVVFAVEELGHVFDAEVSGIILVTVAVSGLVTAVIPGGEYEYFSYIRTPFHSTPFAWLLLAALAGGLLGGLQSLLISLGTSILTHSPSRFASAIRSRPWISGLLAGLVFALLGLLPGSAVYGAGYELARAQIADLRHPSLSSWTFAAFPSKFLGTLFFNVSGLPGGLFSPSLSAGVALGWSLARASGLGIEVVLVACSAYFAAVTQGPLTAFVVVRDVFGLDSSWILPLLSAAIAGSWASSMVQPRPLYELLAEIALEGAMRGA